LLRRQPAITKKKDQERKAKKKGKRHNCTQHEETLKANGKIGKSVL